MSPAAKRRRRGGAAAWMLHMQLAKGRVALQGCMSSKNVTERDGASQRCATCANRKRFEQELLADIQSAYGEQGEAWTAITIWTVSRNISSAYENPCYLGEHQQQAH